MIDYSSGFQGNALGFFSGALGGSKGRDRRKEKAEAKAPGARFCTSVSVQFASFICTVLE